MKRKQNGFAHILILTVILAIAVIALIGYNFYQNNKSEDAVKEVDKPVIVLNNGFIEGSLTYPSEVIPAMTIYAENIDTGETYSTTTLIKNSAYTYGTGYKLEVPIGDYYVYGSLVAPMGSIATTERAYYNDYVKCNLTVKFSGSTCQGSDTAKKVVSVEKNKTTSNIGAGDWWND